MNLQTKIILLIAFGLACAGLGAYGWSKTHDPQPVEKIVIKEVEKPVYKIIKQIDPNNADDCRKLALAPIRITHDEVDSLVVVKATNGYSETTVKWKVYEKPDYTGEIVVGAVVAVVAIAVTSRVTTGKWMPLPALKGSF